MLRDYTLDTIDLEDGGLIEIGYDLDPWNPRESGCNFGTMICEHSRYSLGDERPDSRIQSADVLRRYYAGTSGEYLDLYLLDHSGLALRPYRGSEYMGWDTSYIGIIYVTKAQIIAEFGDASPESRAKARTLLAAETAEYSAYLNGECYCWECTDADGDVIDSCGGFFDLDECRDSAREYAESIEEV